MQCPKCQFENPQGIKFCGECGAKLERLCPSCNSSSPPNFKFCGECGHKFDVPVKTPPKELSFDEKLNKIQKYLPKGLTEKVLSQRDKIEGERKQVTVMFCDMEGFTKFSEKLGPEDAYTIMDKVYEILIHKVHDYEGTVNEMTGDGIMALFGAPIALEDAPQRAIRSAYAIHREMARFSEMTKQENANMPSFKMRIGIHTGPVVVGALGNDLRVEFKAVGDTVNLASRMEGLAVPGSTYVTEDTFQLTDGLFRFEALGEHAIKGKEQRVKAYRVIALRTSRTRFDVSAEKGLTPFVGRGRELEILLDGFERSKRGRGQAFSIVSEAGLGKSRLLYEFRKAVSNEDVTFQEGKCLSYSRGMVYHPVIDIVKSTYDIKEGDGDFEIRKKLRQGLNILGVDEVSILPYILELLSVQDSGVNAISLSPEAIKDRIIGAFNRIAIKASQIRPLIMAIEDLHWMDKSSEDAFKALLGSIAGASVFLIFTYRPEYVHTWDTKSYHSQITLNRLSNRESLKIVNNLFGSEAIKGDLEDLILEKTEGIPFFIEESIKSFKDLNVIEKKGGIYDLAKDIKSISIPSTIQDVIMARVDKLPEAAKEVLQTGSVIEREFSYELIKQASGLSEQKLLPLLSILKDAELLYERGIDPENTYVFKHALTQEVVYDSILTLRKKELHNQIGQAIEVLYPDNLNEHHGALAEHFIKSNNFESGAKYCKLAGRKAQKTGSFDDAIVYGEKQISCLERLPKIKDVEKNIINARIKLWLYYVHLAQLPEAKAAVDPIIDLVKKQNYKREISLVYGILGHYKHFVEEDIPISIEYFSEALKISEELNDILSSAMTNVFFGLCLSMNVELGKALHYLQNALKINEAANLSWGIAAMKSWIVLNIYLPQGRINLAYETSNEALQIANENGDVHSRAHAYLALGQTYYYKGSLEEAKKHLLKAADLSERIKQVGLIGTAHWLLGEVYFDVGEYKTSQKHHEKVIFICQHGHIFPSWVNAAKIAIARTKVMSKGKDINLNKIYKWYDDINFRWVKVFAPNIFSKILLNIDDQHISEAEDCLKNSIEANKMIDMMWQLAKDYALYTELHKRKGDQSKAKESLGKAIEIFKECNADGWVGKYEKELATLL